MVELALERNRAAGGVVGFAFGDRLFVLGHERLEHPPRRPQTQL